MSALLLCAVLAAAPSTPDVSQINPKVAPGDDFYSYANGKWLNATKIPPDEAAWGPFSILAKRVEEQQLALMKDAGTTPEGQQIATFYAALMDEKGIEKNCIAPLQAQLDAIDAIADQAALAKALGSTLRADVDPINATNFETTNLFGLFVAQALDDPKLNVPYLLEGGLVMPDREYYLATDAKSVGTRAKYLAYVRTMLELAHVPDPGVKAERIVELETKIATAHATREAAGDVKAVQTWAKADFEKKAPGLQWKAFFEAAGLARSEKIDLWHVEPTIKLSALVKSEPLETWKAWLSFHLVDHWGSWLSKPFVDARFKFHSTALRGVAVQKERSRRMIRVTSWSLESLVSKRYAEMYFPPEAKVAAKKIVDELKLAFEARIDALTWMSPITRTRAKAKLATLEVGIGYPDAWEDWSTLKVSADDAVGNGQRAELVVYRRALAKIGKPVDRGEWWMGSQVVNALNLPLQNALVFPAAILQPPFFDASRPSAINYGAIGATIGHEISHSFDDTGAQFDARGMMTNWWAEEDLAHFQAAGQALAKQYSAYEALPGLHVNGQQTLGENISDLAGLATAWDAWRHSLGNTLAPNVGSITAEQAFFVSYAQTWATKVRDETLRSWVIGDGHAPGQFRALTVRNIDTWYSVFGVKAGQKLYLAPEARVRVW